MTEIEATLWGAVIGGAIGIAAVVISYRLSRNMTLEALRITAFNSAAIDFFETFLPTIMAIDERYHLEHTNGDTVRVIIEKNFPQQMSAMLKFRLYLQISEIESFDIAWRDYCRYDIDDGDKHPFLAQYEETVCDGQPTKQLALNRIKKLLSFTKIIHDADYLPG